VPIVGARVVSQLEDNLGCLELTLSVEHKKALDEVSKIDLGFPANFLGRQERTRVRPPSHLRD
jgi:hypothetical protein